PFRQVVEGGAGVPGRAGDGGEREGDRQQYPAGHDFFSCPPLREGLCERPGNRSQSEASRSFTTVVLRAEKICWPSRRAVIRSACLSTAKWCDIDGLEMPNGSASSPAVISPRRKSRKTSRRVGSASALKASFMTDPRPVC